MRKHFRTTLLSGAAVLLHAQAGLFAQTARPIVVATPDRCCDIAVTYEATASDSVGSTFWMQGGSVQLHGRFYGGLGAVADVSGSHIGNIQSSGVGLDMVTATFGPRYTWQPAHMRYALYGQALGGVANAFNSVFPTTAGATPSANSLALKLGGGINVALTPHIGLRAVEANWLRTQLPNSSTNIQNNCQIGAGVVLRFR